jgi:hypothetical protein
MEGQGRWQIMIDLVVWGDSVTWVDNLENFREIFLKKKIRENLSLGLITDCQSLGEPGSGVKHMEP